MRVVKMRGSAHETHPYRLTIGSGGLSITRMSAEQHSEAVENRWPDSRS
jgi:hypothetical protein